MSTLIGVGGPLRSGKDAFAEVLERKHGFVRMGMSDPLHHAMLALDPIIAPGQLRYSAATHKYGYVRTKELFPEARALLQRLGTEVGRAFFGGDAWAKIAERNITRHLAAGNSVVITGVRFPEELEMVHRLGGRSLWMKRPGLDSNTSAHASEHSLSSADFGATILNDGDLNDLALAADRFVKGLSL